jgi:hypothetical protein
MASDHRRARAGVRTDRQRDTLIVRAGTVFLIGGVEHFAFDIDTPVILPARMKAGTDYGIALVKDVLMAMPISARHR